jgi:hypothetical protein
VILSFKKILVYISSPSRQAQRTTEWRNSPNAYLKQEIEETGTPNPKKVTKVNYSKFKQMIAPKIISILTMKT